MSKGERFEGKSVHIANCGQEEPVERFVNDSGYPGSCKLCSQKSPKIKYVLHSPTREDNFPYGTVLVCESCDQGLEKASKSDFYYDLLFGPIKN